MNASDIFTNDLTVRYDEATESLLIYSGLNPAADAVPVRHRLSMLSSMGKDEASKFIGQTILLLVPAARDKVFGEGIK